MSKPGIDEPDEVIKAAEKLQPLPPPVREVVDMMYEILDKNCAAVDYDSKWKVVRDLVGLWQRRENPQVTDIDDINRKLAARKAADEYEQKRGAVNTGAQYSAGYNAAVDDALALVKLHSERLDKIHKQSPFCQILTGELDMVREHISGIKRTVLCDKCKLPIKWLTCTTEACHAGETP